MSAILEIKDLDKHFGGIHVSNHVNIRIEQGELSAIIGPNGAGKTTLFNLITGHITPDGGSVVYQNEDVTRAKPERIVKKGMVRAFQVASLFLEETVFDNVYLAALANFEKNGKMFKGSAVYKDARDHAELILQKIGLKDFSDLVGR